MTLIAVVVFAVYYTALIALLHGVSSLLSILLLAAAVWLIYAMGISKYRDSLPFAAVNAALLAAYFIIVHRLVTPALHPWHWYAFFPLLWWPVSTALKEKAVKPAPVVPLCGYVPCVLRRAEPVSLPRHAVDFVPRPSGRRRRHFQPLRSEKGLGRPVRMDGARGYHLVRRDQPRLYPARHLGRLPPPFALLWWPLSMLLFGRKAKVGETETEL